MVDVTEEPGRFGTEHPFGFPKPVEFELTQEHLNLLREMYVNWYDQAYEGAPGIDIKRPYGNSDVLMDIVEAIGAEVEYDYNDEPFISKELYEHCMKLHRETETAMQIVLCFAGSEAKPGRYLSVDICRKDWKRVE